MVPLQVPGGPELVIVGLILLVFLAAIGGIGGGIVYLTRRRPSGSSPETEGRRIDELKERVAALEAAQDSQNESTGIGDAGREAR